jgi:hypothetical protein
MIRSSDCYSNRMPRQRFRLASHAVYVLLDSDLPFTDPPKFSLED